MTITIKNLCLGHYGYLNGIRCFLDGANSAGGVSVKGSIVNNGNKTIQKISIYLMPYNENGDYVSCSVRRLSERKLDIEKPLLHGASLDFSGENLWYNYSICSCIVVKAEIRYEDETTEVFSDLKIASELKL